MAAAADAGLREAVREVLRSHGGWPGAQGSVAYLFHTVGVLRYPACAGLAALAEAAGAEDLRELDDGEVEVHTDPDELDKVRGMLARAGQLPRSARIMRRSARARVLDTARLAQLGSLVGALRQIAGVTAIYTDAALVPDAPGAAPGGH